MEKTPDYIVEPAELFVVPCTFVYETLAGTQESVWGAPSSFANYAGTGDAAIWSAVALETYAMRYLQTGTEADYQRMETKARQIQTLFEVPTHNPTNPDL